VDDGSVLCVGEVFIAGYVFGEYEVMKREKEE